MVRSLFEGSRRSDCDVSDIPETPWDDCRRAAGAHGDDTSHCSFKCCLLVLGKGKGQPLGVSERALSGVQAVLQGVGEGIAGTLGW